MRMTPPPPPPTDNESMLNTTKRRSLTIPITSVVIISEAITSLKDKNIPNAELKRTLALEYLNNLIQTSNRDPQKSTQELNQLMIDVVAHTLESYCENPSDDHIHFRALKIIWGSIDKVNEIVSNYKVRQFNPIYVHKQLDKHLKPIRHRELNIRKMVDVAEKEYYGPKRIWAIELQPFETVSGNAEMIYYDNKNGP